MFPAERLKGIAPFVYAADAGSFVDAADCLNITSSAVSKSVARLERRLGVTLFERTTRRLSLTDAGRAFYETCSRVLNDLAEAEAVLASQKVDPAGRIRIDLPAAFGRMRVMPLLLKFCEDYPKLSPEISFTDRLVDILEERIDVAVRIGGQGHWPSGLGHDYLGNEKLIFCASPGYLARKPAPVAMTNIEHHACVVYGKPDGTVGPWLFAGPGGDVVRCVPRYRLLAGDASAQVAAVVAGMGIAQVATWLVQDELRTGALVEVMSDLSTAGLPLYLAWPRARQLTPKIDALLKALRSDLRID